MRVTEQRPIQTSVVVDVICDRCGGSCMMGNDSLRGAEYGTFRADWGYVSDHDLETWTADLCQRCSVEFREWVLQKGGRVAIDSPLSPLGR